MKLRWLVFAALLGAVVPAAPGLQTAAAHAGDSWCIKDIAYVYVAGQHDHGPGEGCSSPYQGGPFGARAQFVSSVLDASGAPTGLAEVKVTVYGVFVSSGSTALQRRTIGSCTLTNQVGSAACTFEKGGLPHGLVVANDPTATNPFTLPEPLPGELVRIECVDGSHPGVSGAVRIGCWSTVEARDVMNAQAGWAA